VLWGCRNYWYPLYAFVRRRGHDPSEAEDLTQEFFARLLAGNSLTTVQPEKGRFRTFLLAALKNFLANEWDKSTRLKRGGGEAPISLESLDPESRYSLEPVTSAPDEVVFDRQWARTLCGAVMDRLRGEAERDGRRSGSIN
jgi:RNA polymerase sigma-70 factor (ECF subfamily)